MKPLTPVKYGCLGIAALAAYPFAVVMKDIGTLIVKHPRSMLAAAVTAGLLTYTCTDIRESAAQFYRQGEHAVQQYRMQQRHAQERIDTRIAAVVMQNQALAKALQEERAQRIQLHAKAEYQQRALQQEAAMREATQQAIQHVQDTLQQNAVTEMIAAIPQPPAPPQDRYFLVNVGETLEHISRSLTGTTAAARLLAYENNIIDDRKLLAGQLLRVPASLQTQQHSRLLAQPPAARSVVLEGSRSITDLCQGDARCATEVLSLNQQLGLSYADRFQYRKGARVVYFR